MSGELLPLPGLPPTGNDLIDSLRGLQVCVDELDYEDDKICLIKKGLQVMNIAEIKGRKYSVETLESYGTPSDITSSKRLPLPEIRFVGQLVGLRYLIDYQLPLDCLVLRFEPVQVDENGLDSAVPLNLAQLQVPVISIQTFAAV